MLNSTFKHLLAEDGWHPWDGSAVPEQDRWLTVLVKFNNVGSVLFYERCKLSSKTNTLLYRNRRVENRFKTVLGWSYEEDKFGYNPKLAKGSYI